MVHNKFMNVQFGIYFYAKTNEISVNHINILTII